MPKIPSRFTTATLLCIMFIVSTSFCLAALPTEKNVLVIHPYTVEYPAHIAYNSGLKTGFAQHYPYKINLSYEYLDLARFPHSDLYLAATATYFQTKYQKWQPDVIVTSDITAPFLMKYGQTLFRGIPIIFVWSEDHKPPDNLPSDYIVLSATIDFEKNVQLILTTRPAVKSIYIVLGDSDDERRVLQRINRAVAQYDGKVDFIFMNKLPYTAMRETLRQAGGESAILYVRWVADVAGSYFVPAQVIKTIAQEATVPVYGTNNQYIGSGTVGGYVFNAELVGRNVAETATKVFAGKKAAELTMKTVASSEYSFDWRELQRWKIDETKLPVGNKIEYRQIDLWTAYKGYITAGILLLLLQTILIFTLVTNRIKRKKAENNLVKMNTSLEEIVSQRTLELQKTNDELQIAKNLLEALNEQLDLTSRTDSLTGLYNRRHMEERLREAFEKHVRCGAVFSVMIADIDSFKVINDNYGHPVGDCLLKLISRVLHDAVRPYDIVARWGGEEFLLLFPEVDSKETATLAERIRQRVAAQDYSDCGNALAATITIGVSTIRQGDTINDLVKRADDAMYQGKHAGRNRVVTI